MRLPEAEGLLAELASKMRAEVGPDTGIVGIHTGGVWVAQRLHALLGSRVPLGEIDIAFYRDDFEHRGLKPGVRPSALPFDVNGRDIVLVDDVLYTGRTVRAALNMLFDYGRPGRVRLAALVDRGGRQLPIAPDFVGGFVTVPSERAMLVLRHTDSGSLELAMEEGDAGAS